jgi:hypothetical protein
MIRLNFDNIPIHPLDAPPVLHPPSPILPHKVDSLQSISAKVIHNNFNIYTPASKHFDELPRLLKDSMESDPVKIQKVLELTQDPKEKLAITRFANVRAKMPELMIRMYQKNPKDKFLWALVRRDDLVNWSGLNNQQSSLELKGLRFLLDNHISPFPLERALMRQVVQHLDLLAASPRIEEANQLFTLVLQESSRNTFYSKTFLALFRHTALRNRQTPAVINAAVNDAFSIQLNLRTIILMDPDMSSRLTQEVLRSGWYDLETMRVILANPNLFQQIDNQLLEIPLKGFIRESNAEGIDLLFSKNAYIQRLPPVDYLKALTSAMTIRDHTILDSLLKRPILERIPADELEIALNNAALRMSTTARRVRTEISQILQQAPMIQ